ncbi:MAG: serine/threonine protein kinase [Planctomycetes bacterium]|nr:serine/threonine protein kinase [Planctomycetota bacterium]
MDSNPPSDPNRIESLFAEALERPAAERTAFLDRACADDTVLRSEVESLLSAHDETWNLVDSHAHAEARQAAIRATVEAPGMTIGRYKLLQEIGHGGFGTVWMAEQGEPVRRRVALKVIKLGMDTRQVVARFEAERQALAMMDHPGIAKVFDGGATDSGRPYFVMELVKGIPITQYCDEHSLDTSERLRLFAQVCHAVQHAHQKGIIHRDLKPSNVLVTLHDGVAVPKVIDFGIAKATSQRLTDKTLFTEFRQFIGTPEYMAPEQAELSGLDIDTRADIYSLGVLLYELLTGTRPFDLHDLVESGYDEVVRHIREVDPPKPSTRTTTIGDKIAAIAQRRRIAPKQLTKMLRKDLDWIVMKALEKDRSRRYATASAFADDVGRFLTDQPVAARPPSAGYRLRKYARRHRLGVAAGSLVAVALVVGLALAASGYVEARRQRDAARDSEALAIREKTTAEAAREEERKQRERAGTVVDLLRTMMSSANPRTQNGRDYTVRQLLDHFSSRLGDQLKSEPEVEATIDSTIGSAFRELGVLDKASAHLSAALETCRHRFGEASEEYLAAAREWALLVRDRGDYREAERVLREALEARRRAPTQDSECLASTLDARADVLRILGRYEESERLAQDALAMQKRLSGEDSQAFGEAQLTLARLRQERGDFAGAETKYRNVMDLRTKLNGDDSIDVG